jgi:threonine/homoserine/homoserine lactone efflux protein
MDMDMDTLTTLAIQVIAVSASGALSPGPLTIATIALGARGGWRSGILVSLGHTLFELPYLVVLVFAFNVLTGFLRASVSILAVVGALVILYFAYLLLRDAYRGVNLNTSNTLISTNPLIVGFMFTALNPYFLIWWLSIGMTLIAQIQNIGLTSLVIIYPAHVWLDFAWLSIVAGLSKRGSKALSLRGQRIMLAILGVILIIFALNTILKSTLNISIIP